jgi:hypothetical protein
VRLSRLPLVVAILSFAAAVSLGACGSGDSSAPPDMNATCGNGMVDPGEACDGQNLNLATCAMLTMGMMPTGSPLCNVDCKGFTTTGCMTTGQGTGTGGGPGMGTGTGGGP